jgi:type VI secretion system protein ImpM
MTKKRFRIAYFGKVPTRGDFVKNADHPQLLDTLDAWVAKSMEQLASDPGWKSQYDATHALQFAFLGSRSRLAIAGHLAPSRDSSSRRFPFLTATPIEISHPLEFIARSPTAFSRLWNQMSTGTALAMRAQDEAHANQALQAMNEIEAEIHSDADDGFDNFVELQTLERIEQMLQHNGHPVRLRDIVLAIGLLLGPVMASGSSRLDKGVVLPLPEDPVYRNLLAAFWMTLIAPFMARADFELATFIGKIGGAERLVVGFSGASSRTLAGILTPHGLADGNIVLEEATWVNDHLAGNPGVAKLASYLDQPQLSLRIALNTFREVFIGA